jgi:hypothetical protein
MIHCQVVCPHLCVTKPSARLHDTFICKSPFDVSLHSVQYVNMMLLGCPLILQDILRVGLCHTECNDSSDIPTIFFTSSYPLLFLLCFSCTFVAFVIRVLYFILFIYIYMYVYKHSTLVSTGNTFHDLPWLRDTADSTERHM